MTLYIYGDIATKSGIACMLKKDAQNLWDAPIVQTGKLPVILAFFEQLKSEYLQQFIKEPLTIKFVTYTVPYIKNIKTVNALSKLQGIYAGYLQGLFQKPVELYEENEKSVAKHILGMGNLPRREKKQLTKKLMKEQDEDLADALMLYQFHKKFRNY